MTTNEEITVVFRHERRFASGFCIGLASSIQDGAILPDPVEIVGQWEIDELKPDHSYRIYGHRGTYNGKQQFKLLTFTPAEPHGRDGVIAYLRYAGEGNGIGTARAVKMWELFGADAVRMLREEPERVAAQIKGLEVEKAKAASLWLQREKAVESATIELTNILAGRGFPRETSRKAIKEWGNKAAELVRRDPYSLMNFRGCGFKRCDNLWLELGLPANRLRRQALCAWYAVASDSEGHTWYPVDFAVHKLAGLVGSTEIRPAAALRMAKRIGQRNPDRNGALATMRSDSASGVIVSEGGSVWLAEGRKAWCENILAEKVVAAESELLIQDESHRFIDRFPGYRFGVDGSVSSCWTNGGKQSDEWKPIKPDVIKGGYLRVRLRTGPQQYEAIQVSHLILEAFVGKRPVYLVGKELVTSVACHRDGNPQNNNIRNLRWDTRPANEEDKKLSGTHQTGSGNPAAKLTEQDAIEIRQLYSETDISTYQLADQFGISRRVVSQIINRELWTHV